MGSHIVFTFQGMLVGVGKRDKGGYKFLKIFSYGVIGILIN